MADKYRDFQELRSFEKEGTDFRIETFTRPSPVCVIAIHGGRIEPGTAEIARAIAGDRHSLYIFSGLKDARNFSLHITSGRFDEPRALDLVSRSEKTISVHGEKGEGAYVMIGGLDHELIKKAKDSLEWSGFMVLPARDDLKGGSIENICNRCRSGKGLQLEISRGLRDELMRDGGQLRVFSSAFLF